MLKGSLNEGCKKWMCLVRFGLKFRMELNPNKPRVVLYFDDFYKISVRVGPRYDQPSGFEILAIGIVEFEAMTMAFGNFLFPVCGISKAVFFEGAWACP